MCQVVFVTVDPNHVLQVECCADFSVYLELRNRDDYISIENCRGDYVFMFVSFVCSNGLVAIVVRPIESSVIDRLHKTFRSKRDSNRGARVCKCFSIPNNPILVEGLLITKIHDLKSNSSRGAEWL